MLIGFAPATGRWEDQAVVRLDAGTHTLRIARDPCLPHITALRLTPTDALPAAPVLARRHAALTALVADLEGALKSVGAQVTHGLLQQATDLATAVRQVDLATAAPDATEAPGDVEARVSALRVPAAGLCTEALAGSKGRIVPWASDP